MKNNTFCEIFDVMKSHKDIVIVTHTSPDGDAVASATALSLALKSLGIDATILTEEIDEKYSFMPYDKVKVVHSVENLECDLFISVDCGDKDRFTEFVELFDNAKATLNFDHHITNDYYADYNYIDITASSTSQIIYLFLEEMKLLSADIATCIYAGIVFDTGGFMHDKTSKVTFEIAGKLLDFGIPHTEIYRSIMYSRTLEQNKATGYVLGNMEILENGVAYLAISYDDFIKSGIPVEAFDSSVNNLINTRNVDVAFTAFEKKQGATKVSLRAHKFDVNKVASAFGGGGHILASGCLIREGAYKSKELILEEIKRNGK